MDKNLLIKQSKTAQVRILTEEFLCDGCIHSRREIVENLQKQQERLGLPEWTPGNIAGGIQQATMNCEKLGRGSFRVKPKASNNPDEPRTLSRSQAAAQIIQNAIDQLSELARQIDYLNATEEEMSDLEKLKDSVQKLKEIKKSWEG